jgi:hypothetical protein
MRKTMWQGESSTSKKDVERIWWSLTSQHILSKKHFFDEFDKIDWFDVSFIKINLFQFISVIKNLTFRLINGNIPLYFETSGNEWREDVFIKWREMRSACKKMWDIIENIKYWKPRVENNFRCYQELPESLLKYLNTISGDKNVDTDNKCAQEEAD